MSGDEIARILHVSKAEAKSIKASLAKADKGAHAEAWAEYEKEFDGPDTPSISREASLAASEESIGMCLYCCYTRWGHHHSNIIHNHHNHPDTSGPIPHSKPLPAYAAPRPTQASVTDANLIIDNTTLTRYVAALDTINRVEASNAETLLPQESTKLQGLLDIARCKQTEFDDYEKETEYAKSKLKMASKGGIMGRWGWVYFCWGL